MTMPWLAATSPLQGPDPSACEAYAHPYEVLAACWSALCHCCGCQMPERMT